MAAVNVTDVPMEAEEQAVSLPQVYSFSIGPGEDGVTRRHSVVSIPTDLGTAYSGGAGGGVATAAARGTGASFYNIAMFDVSGSMSAVWPRVLIGWNEMVAPNLTGLTEIYTFGRDVKFRRQGTALLDSDNDCSSTNLTGALKMIRTKVGACTHSSVRVFLVTDGHHNCDDTDPNEEISKMIVPAGKTVEVYLLGVGDGFPVQYSVDIRSRMHNGSASCPTIFWSRYDENMKDEMVHIQEEMQKGMLKVTLSIPAKVLPLIEELKTAAHAGELLFYDEDPSELVKTLTVQFDTGAKLPMKQEVQVASAKFLVGKLYKQWNSVLIQRHRNKLPVPMEVFDLMQKAFALQMQETEDFSNDTMQTRLKNKLEKSLTIEFATLMNQSRNVISLESKFKNEIELAEAILKTTVQSRYDSKILQMKGHTDSEWETDLKLFKKLYMSIKDQIAALPASSQDDCCRIMICSFLNDLKDPDFLDVLELGKVDFLTNMSFTGIPIYAPVKDSAQINPWTLYVKNICVSPYEILSQRAMETSMAVNATNSKSTDKEIVLQQDDPDNTVFNAIVPIIPKEHCQLLKKLMRTNVFSVGATFCILKNALIVDHNCHLAALGCVWMKTIKDFPIASRPEYITKRITNVEETAKLYLDRKGVADYLSALVVKPKLGLMTEGTEEHNGSNIKCESMLKPAFLLYLAKDKICSREEDIKLPEMLQMILVELLGRCLSSNTSTTPYMDLLLPNMTTETRNAWLQQISQRVLSRVNLTGTTLLQECYSQFEVPRHTSATAMEATTALLAEGEGLALAPAPNQHRLVRLRNTGSAGHVGWENMRAWAEEMVGPAQLGAAAPLLTPEEVDRIFSDDMTIVYLHHALSHRHSRERFNSPLLTPEAAREEVVQKLKAEQEYFLKTNLLPMVEKSAVEMWQAAYDETHRGLAVPLTRQQIIQQASARGVQVTEETFATVYKYRDGVGLCRNCCHIPECPHYLKPNRSFNCHIETERRDPAYPHALHLVVSRNRESAASLELIRGGTESGTNNRRKADVLPADAEDKVRKYVSDLCNKYDDMGSG